MQRTTRSLDAILPGSSQDSAVHVSGSGVRSMGDAALAGGSFALVEHPLELFAPAAYAR